MFGQITSKSKFLAILLLLLWFDILWILCFCLFYTLPYKNNELKYWGDLVFDDDDEETASEEEWAPPSLQVQRTIERADKHEELMFEEEHKKTEEYNPPRCGNVNSSSTRKI